MTVGGGGGLFRSAAVLTSIEIGRVPVPPVVLAVRPLVSAVMLFGLVEEFGKRPDVRGSCLRQLPFAPGSRVWISWSSQPFPSGSSNEANE